MRKLILALLLLTGAVSAAEVYKWTDDKGRVHYGDRPHQSAEKLNVKPGSGGGVASVEQARKELEALKMQDEKYARCKQRKEQLDVWKKSARIVERDNLGKEKEYSAEDKQRLIQTTEAAISRECA